MTRRQSRGRSRRRDGAPGTGTPAKGAAGSGAQVHPATPLPRLRLLGGFELRLASGEAATFSRRKAQALLAYLAGRPGHGHPRAALAALLWPDASEAQARPSVRQALYDIRQALKDTGQVVQLSEDVVRVDPAAIDIDVVALERLVKVGSRPALEEAAALCRGEFLAGLAVSEAPFEEWLTGERERLRELSLQGLGHLLALDVTAGSGEAAIRTALQLLTLDPLQESVHRTLMRQYLGQGRREAVLRHYQVCVETLQRELGVEPDAETKALYREALQAHARSHATARPAWQEEIAPDGPPLAGRQAELARLRRALGTAGEGRGQLLLVVGEAGVGKSRLLAEIAVLAAAQGQRVLVGRASQGQQTIPFSPWLHALRCGGVLDDATSDRGLDRRWRSELARLFPELGDPPRAATGPEGQVRLFEAVTHLLERAARSGPLLILLEDLHWADEASARFLCFVARRLRSGPVLVVATVREEEIGEQPTLEEALREPGIARLALGPLARQESNQLVLSLSRAKQRTDGIARLAALVWSASQGNPLMVVETMRSLGESPPGAAALTSGESATASGGLPLPERVREIIALRLDRLSERGRRLAALAAVVESEVAVALLERASGLGEREVVDGIEELVRRRVLRVAGERFEFVHHRIQEVAYEGLLAARRRLLHREVAQALEALHPEAPPAAVLGQHYRKAEEWATAAAYLRKAGERAMTQSSFREAAICLEQAVDALDRLPPAAERDALAIDLRLALRAPLSVLGDHPRALVGLEEARTRAEALGDRTRLARVLVQTIGPLRLTSRPDEALAVGERALELARALDDPDLVLLAGSELGALHYLQWSFERATVLLEETARELAGQPADIVGRHGPRIYGLLATVWGGRSRFDLAIAQGERALALAEAAGRPESVAFALYCLAFACQRRGELTRAVALSERCLALAREHEVASAVQWAAAALGDAKAALGRGAEAVTIVEEAVTAAAATNSAEPSTRVVLARVYFSCGRLDDAARELEHALSEARRLGKRGVEATAIHLGADLAAARGPASLEQAAARYERAMALASELEIRHLVAHCHRGLGDVRARLGDRARAAEHRAAAEKLYRELGMAYWVDQMATPSSPAHPGSTR